MNIYKASQTRPKQTPSGKKPPPVKPKPNQVNKENEKEPVEVFCRIRPVKSLSDLVCVYKHSETILTLRNPSSSRDDCHYSFKHIFDENVSQKDLFDNVAFPLITDLLSNKDGLLFAYGITSSGKTHTISGTPSTCGVLPRALDVVFNSIKEKQARKYAFKTDGQNTFEVRSPPDALLEWQKEKNFASRQTPATPNVYGKTSRIRRQEALDLKEWGERDRDPSVAPTNDNFRYAVFLTYVEIYNNYIYDLLDETTVDQLKTPMKQQPTSKFLREDARKRIFVFGATEIEVENSEEAFETFLKGVKRRKMAHTVLNTESSRSHSVFNIRVVRAPIDADGELVQDQQACGISQLSIVDLAGSERTNRTQQNSGERQREAGSINNSLMALRNCIELLRENQKNNMNKIIPYRDNKLTHLFKNYFEGGGKVRMIICVNPSKDDYQETLHVMKFAETTQEVLISKASEYQSRFRRGIGYDPNFQFTSVGALGPALPTTLFTNDPNDEKVIPEWLECLEERKKIATRKAEQLQNKQLEFREQLVDIEKQNFVTKQENERLRTDLAAREHQLKLLESQCGQSERTGDAKERKIALLEKQVKQMQRDMDDKERALSQAEVEKERMKQKFSEKLREEQIRIQRIYEREMQEKASRLNREKCINEEKINKVHEILCANNNDWNLFGSADQNVARSVGTPPSNTVTGSSGLPGKEGCSTPSRTTTSNRSPSKARSKSVENPHKMKTRSDYDLVEALSPKTDVFSDYNVQELPPVANPRHKRSLSNGTEKWIDHRPPGTLELGTVFQSKFRNRKSLSNLKNLGVEELKGASKYALTHHTADVNGEVETNIYKGEIIPSTGGGAQVIFNDVETLRQGSPPGRKRGVSDGKATPGMTPSTTMMNDPEIVNSPMNVTKRSRR